MVLINFKMAIPLHRFLLLIMSVGILDAAVTEDLVTSLPGLSFEPKWKHYSGYLNASGTKRLHYWFFESARNSKTDPVLLWMNGGPGCSSLVGLFTENGPFRVMLNGTVVYHAGSWNEIANVLYLEAPAGVGMSYSDDKYYRTNDDETASDNYLAIVDFFTKYPEYSNNSFYITGESYGGIYVPTLSALVVRDPEINFKGMAIGNGMSNYVKNENAHLYLAYYRGMIGDSLWKDLITYCCNGTLEERCMFTLHQDRPHCKDAFNAAHGIVFEGRLNFYNIYHECRNSMFLRFDEKLGKFTSGARLWMSPNSPRLQKEDRFIRSLPVEKLKISMGCLDTTSVDRYLNTPEVRRAIHVPEFVPRWEVETPAVMLHYAEVYPDLSEQHRQVLAAGKRIMMYNGDVDFACDFLGESWFVEDLGLEVISKRKMWHYTAQDGTTQVGGFIKKFQNYDLVTVRGGGHLSPADKPFEVLQMMKNFLAEE